MLVSRIVAAATIHGRRLFRSELLLLLEGYDYLRVHGIYSKKYCTLYQISKVSLHNIFSLIEYKYFELHADVIILAKTDWETEF